MTVNTGVDSGALAPYPPLGVAASTSISKGDLVAFDADGYVVAADDTANTFFLGVALADADNSSGSDGDIDVEVAAGYIFATFTSASAANNGSVVYANGSNSVALAATTTNDVAAGVQIKVSDTNEVMIYTPPGGSAVGLG